MFNNIVVKRNTPLDSFLVEHDTDGYHVITDAVAGDVFYYNGSKLVRLEQSIDKFLRSKDGAPEWDTVDHGELDGLGDDDHSQYTLAAPTSSVGAIPRFTDTDGRTIAESPATIDAAGTVNIPAGEEYQVNGAQHVHTLADTTYLTYEHNLDGSHKIAGGGTNELVIFNGTLLETVPNDVGKFLRSGAPPTWEKPDIDDTSFLTEHNGGVGGDGSHTIPGATEGCLFTDNGTKMIPLTAPMHNLASGDLLYASTTNTISKLALGTEGYILGAGASAPAWVAQGKALSKSVAGSSNVTLTAAEAGNPTLILTGALTGNINVIIPAVAMTRTFYNAATGAYTINVKTAAGAACLVPQNQAVAVLCDGTDCVNLNNLMGAWSNVQVYNSGSGTWTVPNGITRCFVRIWGGGGGGGGSDAGGRMSGGGGGGGGYAEKLISDLTPAGILSYVVGAGGAGAAAGGGNNGSAGTSSTFGGVLTATGGGGGTAGTLASSGSGGAGGSGTGGDIVLTGAQGSRANGDATSGYPGGHGGGSPMGGPGGFGYWASAGTVGRSPGGGAGGQKAGEPGAANAGANGLIVIYY